MGALLIAPRRYWWFYLLAILPAHLIAQLPLPDVALVQVLTQYVLNCATALIGAFALAHFEPGTHRFDRMLPAWRLVFFGGLLAPFTTSILMAAIFVTTDIDRSFWLTTVARALTNTFAILTVVPLMVHVAGRLNEKRRFIDVARIVEGAVLAICLATASVAALLAPPFEAVASAAMLCLPLPMLLWAAARFGVVGSSAAVLLFGVFAVCGALSGVGPFTAQADAHNTLSVVLFLVVTCIPLLLLGAALDERRSLESCARRERRAARRGTGVDPGSDRDPRRHGPHRRRQRIVAAPRRAHSRRTVRLSEGRRALSSPLHPARRPGRCPRDTPRATASTR